MNSTTECNPLASSSVASAKDKVSRAISALHGIRWAAAGAHSDGDIDAFLCLIDAVLPQLGVELEAAHSALGGKPIGYFAPACGEGGHAHRL